MKRHRKKVDSESTQSAKPHAVAELKRTDRIARLLSDLAGLMRQEEVGKEAIHHLRQLQMRFRFAKDHLASDRASPEMPKEPPALWVARANKAESPVDFIKREYGKWLGQGLTRAHLRIDMALYDAYKLYLRDHQVPERFDLPTKSEMIDRKLAAGRGLKVHHSDEQKERLRLREAARRRKAKPES